MVNSKNDFIKDLVFNKKIDGCDQPTNVKCKVKTNRGGAQKATTTTPFPRTTEYDRTLLEEYDYFYDEYYYDDPTLTENVADASPPAEENTIIRNSGGGSQFQVTQEEIPESGAPSSGSVRNRPQYTSIQRDRYE